MLRATCSRCPRPSPAPPSPQLLHDLRLNSENPAAASHHRRPSPPLPSPSRARHQAQGQPRCLRRLKPPPPLLAASDAQPHRLPELLLELSSLAPNRAAAKSPASGHLFTASASSDQRRAPRPRPRTSTTMRTDARAPEQPLRPHHLHSDPTPPQAPVNSPSSLDFQHQPPRDPPLPRHTQQPRARRLSPSLERPQRLPPSSRPPSPTRTEIP